MLIRTAACLLGFLALASAQEWPQWRGPNRDGVAASISLPKPRPEKFKLQWKVNVGEGYSSPVVAAGKIYVHARQGEREVVSCLRPEDGKMIWQEGYPAPYTVSSAAARHGKGVKSTPVVQDGRLYTLGISGILSCFDAQTGRLQWRKQFSGPEFGTAMSPMVDRGLLIAYVGFKEGGALAALDAQTGDEKWSWKGDGPAYASPIVADLAGTRQVVTQSRHNIIGVSVATGELLWQIPFATPYEQNIVTPVLYRDLLVFSGIDSGVVAVKLSRRGATFVPETVWRNDDVPMYMSSPVVSGDLLFGFTNRNRGQFFCLDPRSGATLWTSAPRQGDNAAIVDAGSMLLLLTSDAELIVAGKNGKAFEPLQKYTVADSPTWAHPVILKNGILVKDATTLALWQM